MFRSLDFSQIRGAVRWILISSFLMYLITIFVPGLIPILGFVPARVTDNFWFWQPFTYPFLHGGFLHWLFNMLVLWMCGQELENRWGTRYFLIYFFSCSFAAAFCVWAIAPHSAAATIGASG